MFADVFAGQKVHAVVCGAAHAPKPQHTPAPALLCSGHRHAAHAVLLSLLAYDPAAHAAGNCARRGQL
jgi:hypothetical protein